MKVRKDGMMKKVLVVGANGKIGRQVVDKLHENSDYDVYAGLRKDDQIAERKGKGIHAVKVDLEGELTALEEAAKGMDAIVFSAGSGGSTGDDKTILVDLDGAVKMMLAAQNQGVKRFVMVSSMFSNVRDIWSYGRYENAGVGNPYFAAKHYADEALQASDLDYTIIRPSTLQDDAGTGKISLAEQFTNHDERTMKIPREDVAETIIAVLGNDHTIGKTFDLDTGDTSIAEVVEGLG